MLENLSNELEEDTEFFNTLKLFKEPNCISLCEKYSINYRKLDVDYDTEFGGFLKKILSALSKLLEQPVKRKASPSKRSSSSRVSSMKKRRTQQYFKRSSSKIFKKSPSKRLQKLKTLKENDEDLEFLDEDNKNGKTKESLPKDDKTVTAQSRVSAFDFLGSQTDLDKVESRNKIP
jgi:hypothetical protein